MSGHNRRRRRRGHGPVTSNASNVTEPHSSCLAERHTIEPFALFCAYHLGITEDDGYRFQNIHHVAKRFGTNAGVIKQLLTDYDMAPETIVHSSFDMASAQVDIMVAPEGISRTELARHLFDEFRSAPRRGRDWKKELEEDARINERTFGRR